MEEGVYLQLHKCENFHILSCRAVVEMDGVPLDTFMKKLKWLITGKTN